MLISHSIRHRYPQPCQRSGQLLPSIIRDRDQHSTFGRILFRDDPVAVIEEIKAACQIESVFCQERGFGAGFRGEAAESDQLVFPELVSVALRSLLLQRNGGLHSGSRA